MRVGIYVDGFNLYYGGKSIMGGSSRPGWKWLDLRKLSERLIAEGSTWSGASVSRVVYCTARIHAEPGSMAHRDQDLYIKALRAYASVDVCEMGSYVSRLASAPLARRSPNGKPELVTSTDLLSFRDAADAELATAKCMVRIARREEKGSDVNVATHLLVDMYEGRIDAAVVVSNDSDLAFPVRHARERIPVGVVNPQRNPYAGALRGDRGDGVGGHWWYKLAAGDLTSSQLPAAIGRIRRPVD